MGDGKLNTGPAQVMGPPIKFDSNVAEALSQSGNIVVAGVSNPDEAPIDFGLSRTMPSAEDALASDPVAAEALRKVYGGEKPNGDDDDDPGDLSTAIRMAREAQREAAELRANNGNGHANADQAAKIAVLEAQLAALQAAPREQAPPADPPVRSPKEAILKFFPDTNLTEFEQDPNLQRLGTLAMLMDHSMRSLGNQLGSELSGVKKSLDAAVADIKSAVESPVPGRVEKAFLAEFPSLAKLDPATRRVVMNDMAEKGIRPKGLSDQSSLGALERLAFDMDRTMVPPSIGSPAPAGKGLMTPQQLARARTLPDKELNALVDGLASSGAFRVPH